jgi:predicted aconitase
MKYPDYLDICIALTGRAPLAGCHTDEGRRATLAIDVELPPGAEPDDALWPLLGYCVGLVSASDIPLVRGLERASGGSDALKAFGAAFATTSAAPMFHIAGHTPEAAEQSPHRAIRLSRDDLGRGWRELDAAASEDIDLVSLGNPHFSLTECARLAALVRGRAKSLSVEVIVTLGRDVHEAAARAGYVADAEAFGVRFVTDTCWCFVGEPLIPPAARTLMTNSGKYAHYGPGLVGRGLRFGSLAACVEAACTGRAAQRLPEWLV